MLRGKLQLFWCTHTHTAGKRKQEMRKCRGPFVTCYCLDLCVYNPNPLFQRILRQWLRIGYDGRGVHKNITVSQNARHHQCGLRHKVHSQKLLPIWMFD